MLNATQTPLPPAQVYAQPSSDVALWRRVAIFIAATILYLRDLSALLYRSVISPYWEGRRGRSLGRHMLLRQVYVTACQSIPLTVFIAVAIGVLLMHEASVVLPLWGFPDYAEWLTVKILFREIAPMTVALIVIARSANAVVIELGNMHVNGELRALEVLGINIDRYINLPRIIAMMISVVLLTLTFCFFALYVGFGVAESADLLESNFLLDSLVENFNRDILLNILLRALCFGLVIGTVSCLHGHRVQISPTEVPEQAGKGVVRSLSLCFVLNFVISLYFQTEQQP